MKGYNPRFLKMHGKFQDVVVSQQNQVPVVRDRVFENPTKSQAQVQQQISFKSTKEDWKLLTPEGRESYVELGSRMLGKSGKPMKGHNCYTHITETRALMGLEPLPMAPAAAPPKPAPQMPSPLFLSSVHTGTAFQLLIHSAAATGPFLLECAPWVSAGVSHFNKSSFRVCASLDNLASSGTSIGAAFADRFSTPPAGSQVVVRLTPLTETGFRGATVVYSAFVAATEAEMLEDLERRREVARRKRTDRTHLLEVA